MLDLRDHTLHYDHSQILYDISMSAKLGDVTCVMGTNGVGKISLLRYLSDDGPAQTCKLRNGGFPLIEDQFFLETRDLAFI